MKKVWFQFFPGIVVLALLLMLFSSNTSLPVTTQTFSVGSNPQELAIDASGNVWVSNFNSTNVTELSSSGAVLGTFSVGSGPRGVAIDASGNVWVANVGSANVTKLQNAAAGPEFFPYSGPVFPHGF